VTGGSQQLALPRRFPRPFFRVVDAIAPNVRGVELGCHFPKGILGKLNFAATENQPCAGSQISADVDVHTHRGLPFDYGTAVCREKKLAPG
jgi:hypothetical protein